MFDAEPSNPRLFRALAIYYLTFDEEFGFKCEIQEELLEDLIHEFNAAVQDRWFEWIVARKADLPLGEFVQEEASG